jgi:hypothetical protein
VVCKRKMAGRITSKLTPTLVLIKKGIIMKSIFAICILVCLIGKLFASQDSVETIGIKQNELIQRNTIIIKSRFWGTFESNGSKINFWELKKRYINLGNPELLNHRRNALLIKWIGPLPFYSSAIVLASQGVPAYIGFPILLVGIIPAIIGDNMYLNTVNEYNKLIQENKTTIRNQNGNQYSLKYSIEF